MDAVRADVRRLKQRVDKLAGAGARTPRVERMANRLAAQADRIREQARAVRRTQARVEVLKVDHERMAQQLAATETRIEWLRERVDPEVFDGTTAERVEARSLIEEIRREHDQIRIRMQVVSNYEERLARVEEIVSRWAEGESD